MPGGNLITKTCISCGKQFKARNRDVKMGWGKYCSVGCGSKERWLGDKNPNYLGSRAYKVHPTSRKRRDEILNRDNHKCTQCDSEANTTIHHIVPIREGGGEEHDNLITLCMGCHNRIEHGRQELIIA